MGHNTCTHPGLRSKSAPSLQENFFLHREYVIFCRWRRPLSAVSPVWPLCNHGDKLLASFTLIWNFDATAVLFILLLWLIFYKPFSSVCNICLPAHGETYSCSTLLSFVRQLKIQHRLASLAKHLKAHSSETILIFMNILSREITHPSSCWDFCPRENSL